MLHNFVFQGCGKMNSNNEWVSSYVVQPQFLYNLAIPIIDFGINNQDNRSYG